MNIKFSSLAMAIIGSISLMGCSDSDDSSSPSEPSTMSTTVTLSNSENLSPQDQFNHHVTSEGYVLHVTDNTGVEQQISELKLNEPVEVTFSGSALLTVSHPNDIDSVQMSYTLAADATTVNSESPVTIPMNNDSWQAISVDCNNVNAAQLGMVQGICEDKTAVTFYQKGEAADLVVSMTDGVVAYQAIEESSDVGMHDYYEMNLSAESEVNNACSNSVSTTSEHFAMDYHCVTVESEELSDFVVKSADEISYSFDEEGNTIYHVASYAKEGSSSIHSNSGVLDSEYNVITLHGPHVSSGYPLEAYKEPTVDIDNINNPEEGWMNIYLDNASKHTDKMAFIVYFGEGGVVSEVKTNIADKPTLSWNEFVDTYGKNLVNSSFVMNDLDMTSILQCVLGAEDESNAIIEDVTQGDLSRIDEECLKELISEIQTEGIEQVHIGNMFWRSNSTSVNGSPYTDEVRLDIRKFDVGLIQEEALASSVHQQNSRGLTSFVFDGDATMVTWDVEEPKVWINYREEGKTIGDYEEGIDSLIANNLVGNPGSYINIYLTSTDSDGLTVGRCVTLRESDGKHALFEPKGNGAATCSYDYLDEDNLTLDEIVDRTTDFTIRTDYFDALDRGNFFWRGKEMISNSATLQAYNLSN